MVAPPRPTARDKLPPGRPGEFPSHREGERAPGFMVAARMALPPTMKGSQRYTVSGIDSQGRGFWETGDQVRAGYGLLPGDVVELTTGESGLSDSFEILEKSPSRIQPDCPFHGPCGGCDLLELSEKARIQAKSDCLSRTLKEIISSGPDHPGGASGNADSLPAVHVRPFLASPSSVRYRPRMRLHQGRDRKKPEVGFLPSERYEGKVAGGVVPVTSCLLLTKPLNKRLVALRAALARLPFRFNGFFVLGSDTEGETVAGHLVLSKGWTANRVKGEVEKLMRSCQLAGVSIGPEEGGVTGVVGSVAIPGLTAPGVGETAFGAEPSIFVQGNVYQNTKLVQTVIEFCEVGRDERLVEGFSGAGNLTIPLALAGALIEAYESHPGASRMLKRNILKAGLNDRVKIFPEDAFKALEKAAPRPVVLLIDPPRGGMANIRRVVEKIQPDRVVYVSCDLESIRRDARNLLRSGYRLTDLAGIDLYPRTSHIESVWRFAKTAGK